MEPFALRDGLCYPPFKMSIFSKAEKACDPGRVLIVDDEGPVRKLFKMILAEDMPSLIIDEACNGLEAVRAFREHNHGVVTMDLRMPVMDGLQAFHNLEKVCEEDRCRMPVVIFCTGFVPPDSVNDIVARGPHHQLLHKPVRSAVIVEAIQNGIKNISPSAS